MIPSFNYGDEEDAKRTLAKWTVIAVIAAAGLWLNAKYLNLSPAHIREGVLSFGIFAPLIYIGLLMIRPFLLLPASVFAVSGASHLVRCLALCILLSVRRAVHFCHSLLHTGSAETFSTCR